MDSTKNNFRDPYTIIKQFNQKLAARKYHPIHLEIVQSEQNQIHFTGERLVINQEVKQSWLHVLVEHLSRYELACEFVKGARVLDAACGTGYGTKMLDEAGAKEVIGVDISTETIGHAKAGYTGRNTQYMVGDILQLPFKDRTFDVIVSFETIEHVPDGSAWIREASRMLTNNGLFLVSTPNRYVSNPGVYYQERASYNQFHCFEYSIIEFMGELLKSFDILELYGHPTIYDDDSPLVSMVRAARQLQVDYRLDPAVKVRGNNLVPLGAVKDAQPEYVLAVCRKKK
ncbi:class I SAM-dependent methyltransferase [Paenibacillus cremeus]|uniref:Class I SAM-dependent methyltransferase n=1 Tax=Paenibacillus cremeus TaxID=2163881 RepID=A0A559KI71_9BACL|nr:class I SAM-dependent methyltransferase [Paenibacillus cremeus]TVY11834.1 class I SAM-dependent methyltransferase [Paenibacillus cremeus]